MLESVLLCFGSVSLDDSLAILFLEGMPTIWVLSWMWRWGGCLDWHNSPIKDLYWFPFQLHSSFLYLVVGCFWTQSHLEGPLNNIHHSLVVASRLTLPNVSFQKTFPFFLAFRHFLKSFFINNSFSYSDAMSVFFLSFILPHFSLLPFVLEKDERQTRMLITVSLNSHRQRFRISNWRIPRFQDDYKYKE